MKPAIVLLAHGSRDPRWATPLQALAERVRAQAPTVELRLAFLELMAPDLAQAGAELAAAGCTEVVVLPLFFGAGNHLRQTLPGLLDDLRALHPGLRWTLQPPVGELPAVMDAIAAAALAALGAAHSAGPP